MLDVKQTVKADVSIWFSPFAGSISILSIFTLVVVEFKNGLSKSFRIGVLMNSWQYLVQWVYSLFIRLARRKTNKTYNKP